MSAKPEPLVHPSLVLVKNTRFTFFFVHVESDELLYCCFSELCMPWWRSW